ncbi:MAG TPA: metal ABC transporter permease [Candidatus Kapabacteria bacterium]|nr:metal ABC transporter permease [Candidatus Kapabacteria bacterium]
MLDLIPPFNFQDVVLAPWQGGFSAEQPASPMAFWQVLMGFMVASACGLVGNYLMLRRMALVGDAISHSVLPGIAIAFLFSGSRGSIAMFSGALLAGIVTTVIIEAIHRNSRIKQDAAIGIAFTTLFAIGVILISVFAGQVDLDQECVLYGEIGTVPLEESAIIGGHALGPLALVRMGIVLAGTVLLIGVFYKELLVSSFDPSLASSMGFNSTAIHYGLMSWLSVVVVSAFESVGAILVIAMLILPGATARLLSNRLGIIMFLTVVNCVLASLFGVHLAFWLNCSMAAAIVVCAAGLFCIAWIFSPSQGLIRRGFHRFFTSKETPQFEISTTKQAPVT